MKSINQNEEKLDDVLKVISDRIGPVLVQAGAIVSNFSEQFKSIYDRWDRVYQDRFNDE